MTSHAEPLAAGWHDAGSRSRLRYVFTRDFATADGHRVMVAALTPRQFADLATMARLARGGNQQSCANAMAGLHAEGAAFMLLGRHGA